jgi:hypothetical protein
VFDSYRNKCDNVRMKREDGILEVALHSGGGPLVFNGYVHEALVGAFRDIGDDPENHVVILTGTGDDFSRMALSTRFRRRLQEGLSYGLALEGISAAEVARLNAQKTEG